jgi:hypothetical protein
MAGTAKDLGRTYQVMEDVLKAMNKTIDKMDRSIKDSNSDLERTSKRWREINVSVTSMVRTVDDAEDSFRRILSIQHQLSRDPGFFNKRSTSEVKAFYADLLKQAERISKVGLGARGMKELRTVTDGLKKSMAELGKITANTLSEKDAKKFAAALKDINDQVLELGDSVKEVKFGIWGDTLKKTGRAFEETFDKKFSDTVFGQMLLGKFGKHMDRLRDIGKIGAFGKRLQEVPADQKRERIAGMRERLGENHDLVRAYTKMQEDRKGTASVPHNLAPSTVPTGKKGKKGKLGTVAAGATADAIKEATVPVSVEKAGRQRNAKGQFLPKSASAKMVASPAAAVAQVAVPGPGPISIAHATESIGKTAGLSGWLDRKIANVAMEHAGKVLGGEAVSGVGGMLGKLALRTVGAGGGSATAGIAGGAMGGVLGSVGGLISKASPILGVVSALNSARDMVVEQNKEMQENLGAYGLNAGGVNFTDARKTLMGGGFINKSLYGMATYKQNMEMMAALGKHGYSIADISDENAQKRPDLDKSMEAGTGGFYGSLMKNVQFYGRNVGMGIGESTAQTMKLAEEYRMTMSQTSEFFMQMDLAQKTAGISAGKYVQVMEDINAGFDEFNKGLRTTTMLFNNLGKTGRLTGDQIRDMVKSLTANPQQNLAQRVVTAQTMVASGANKELADDIQKEIDDSIARANESVAQALKAAGISESAPQFTGENKGSVMRFLDARKNLMPDQEYKAASQALQTATQRAMQLGVKVQALRSGKAENIAGAMDITGENPDSNRLENMMAMQNFLRNAGILGKNGAGLASIVSSPQKYRSVLNNKELVTAAMGGVFDANKFNNLQKMFESMNFLMENGALQVAQVGQKGMTQGIQSLTGNEKGSLAEAARALGPETLGVKAISNNDEEAAKQMLEFMAKQDQTGEKTVDLLAKNDGWLKVMARNSSDTAQLLQTQLKSDENMAKTNKMQIETRASAEIFADAFEHLFLKLVDAISTLGKVFNFDNWRKFFGGDTEQAEKLQKQESLDSASDMVEIIQRMIDKGGKNLKEDNKPLYSNLKTLQASAKANGATGRDWQTLNAIWTANPNLRTNADDTRTIAGRQARAGLAANGKASDSFFTGENPLFAVADKKPDNWDSMSEEERTRWYLGIDEHGNQVAPRKLTSGTWEATRQLNGMPGTLPEKYRTVISEEAQQLGYTVTGNEISTNDAAKARDLMILGEKLAQQLGDARWKARDGANGTTIITFPTTQIQPQQLPGAGTSQEQKTP